MTQENTEAVETVGTTETAGSAAAEEIKEPAAPSPTEEFPAGPSASGPAAAMQEASDKPVAEHEEEMPGGETESNEPPKWDPSSHDRAFEEVYQEILDHFRSFTPAEQIASQITEEHITQYLEGGNEERIQLCKERREKRLFHFLEIIAALVSIVLIVRFLNDNPALLTNILYILGGIAALYIWKHPQIKDEITKKEL